MLKEEFYYVKQEKSDRLDYRIHRYCGGCCDIAAVTLSQHSRERKEQ